jgi:5-formyltetrahydrofolate cyclo-ligase
MRQTKTEWRRHLIEVRRTLDAGARRSKSAAIRDRLARLPVLRRARSLLVYRAMGAEVDAGLSCQPSGPGPQGLPGMPPVSYEPFDSGQAPQWLRLEGDRAQGKPVVLPEFPTVVLVPGVGFDLSGNRVGRGRGFYDRALAVLRAAGETYAIGLAFDVQVVPQLAVDPWDQPMELVITESRSIDRPVFGSHRTAAAEVPQS